MESWEDFVRRKFLYKQKPGIVSGVKERVIKMNENRKTLRHDIMCDKRKIPTDASPAPTPIIKKVKTPGKPADKPNERLEMLAKWKAEKERQKQAIKSKLKPVFKVTHVNVPVGLPKLDTVNLEIKGIPFKSKFAPQNHKFKPPSNIKPIDLPKTDNASVERKKHLTVGGQDKGHGMVTRSQVRSVTAAKPQTNMTQKERGRIESILSKKDNQRREPTESDVTKNQRKIIKNKEDVTSEVGGNIIEKSESNIHSQIEKTPSSRTNKLHKTSKMNADKASKGKSKQRINRKAAINESKNNIQAVKGREVNIESKNICEGQTDNALVQQEPETANESASLMSPDFPIDMNANSSGSEEIKTPNKTGPPLYISPFITLSRGKSNARKEYERRRSKSLQSSDCTSISAGAVYFDWLLEANITRLKELCTQWDQIKINDNPPEEAISMVDVAIGQANLFMSKKCVQFRGLIEKCKQNDEETPVTLEDLHGFWDMMHIQIDNLDKRFANLSKLKENDWIEVVPQIKIHAVSKKEPLVKNAKPSVGLKQAIQAARRKKILDKQHNEDAKSENATILTSTEANSPGLTMMKVAQFAKNIDTPVRSILKSEGNHSMQKSQTKVVFFEDQRFKHDFNTENDLNKSNQELKVKTPSRRSRRLSKAKLF